MAKTILDPFGVPHAIAKAKKPAAPAASPPQGGAPPAPTAAPVTQAIASNPFETDPGYLAALAAEQAGSQQLDAALKAAQEAAIVQFGDPGLATRAGLSLDPATAAAAQQSTQSGISTLAQLQKQRDTNQQMIQNQLAAHGIIFSGDLGYKTGQNQQQFGVELENQSQALLTGLAGLSRDTLAQKQGLRQNTVGALTGAYNTMVANPQFWGAVNDGGASGAANAAATMPGYGGSFQVPGLKAQPVTSKLAAKPQPNPYAARTARQTTGWRGY